MLTWIKRAGAGRVVLPSEVPSAGRGAASPRPLVPQDGRGQRFQPVTADQLQLAPVDLQQAVFLETLEHAAHRSEESRVGKGFVSTCRSRWSQHHLKTHTT